VLFGSNDNSYINQRSQIHIIDKMAGQMKHKEFGTAVKAACQGNLSAFYFGHSWHRFGSPVWGHHYNI